MSREGSESQAPERIRAMATDPVRSRIMAAVKGRDTTCELILRHELWRRGLRGYRTRTTLPGKPDIAFTAARVAVFVDGCFWHRCPTCYRPAKQRRDFWDQKIERNVQRDLEVTETLTRSGWAVVRVWEHDVRAAVGCCADKVEATVRGSRRGTGA